MQISMAGKYAIRAMMYLEELSINNELSFSENNEKGDDNT